MNPRIEGIIPVMLTPFSDDGRIDYHGLEALTEWYLAHGCDALFAVCQSSEMYHLTLEERSELARFVVRQVNSRVPVVVSGHISDDPNGQTEELRCAAESGADAVVLVTNHLDPHQKGTATLQANLTWLLNRLPSDIPLGLYECPAPYRRLLSDDELRGCLDTGRFVLLKDVSCDLATVQRRVALATGSPLAVLNANAAIAYPAMQAGSRGFNGVFTNIHPDLYIWLYRHGARHPELAAELANFLVLAAQTESLGYPVLAKLFHQRLGTFASARSRAIAFDVRERYWALDAVIDALIAGTESMRTRIRALPDGSR